MQSAELFGTAVSSIQDDDVEVADGAITGTLKYLDSGAIATEWGAGNFVALKFTVPTAATSYKVGLDPSEGSGLVEIINDPDKNGVFKITNKDTQKFVVEVTNAEASWRIEYDLSGLTCETE